MEIRCPECKAILEIDERALVPPRRTIQCAACGHDFTHSDTLTHPAEATTVPPTHRGWHVRLTNQSQLQCPSDEELRAWIHRQVVTGDCMVSQDGVRWERLRDTALYQHMETPTIDEPGSALGSHPEVLAYRTDIQYRKTEAAPPPAPIILQAPAPASEFRTLLLILLMVTCAGAGWWFGTQQSSFISNLEEPTPLPPERSAVSHVEAPEAKPESSPTPSSDPSSSAAAALPTEAPPTDSPTEAGEPDKASADEPVGAEGSASEARPEGSPPIQEEEVTASGEVETADEGAETATPKVKAATAATAPKKRSRSSQSRKSRSRAHENLSHDAQMRAGNAALRERRWKDAATHFDNAAQQTRSVEPIVKKGIAQMRMGQPEQAMRAFRSALQQNPDYRRTYMALARALEKTGRQREAAHYCREYLRRFPDGSQAGEARRALKRLE